VPHHQWQAVEVNNHPGVPGEEVQLLLLRSFCNTDDNNGDVAAECCSSGSSGTNSSSSSNNKSTG
jgi:hypothetical protein